MLIEILYMIQEVDSKSVFEKAVQNSTANLIKNKMFSDVIGGDKDELSADNFYTKIANCPNLKLLMLLMN